MDINPYSPPQAIVSDAAVGSPEAQDISMSELTAFAGDAKYPKRWLARHQGESRLCGFNVWAAIFGIQWFFFRKLHVQGVLSLVIEMGIPYLISMAIMAAIGGGQAAVLLMIGAILATRIAIGYWANVALYQAGVRTIRRVDAMNLDNEGHLRQIAKAGGVSVPSLLLAYVLLGTLRFVFSSTG
jgi:hypothetical protein